MNLKDDPARADFVDSMVAEDDRVHTITIMKYRIGNNYLFKVYDKFDEKDEVKRLDKMMKFSDELAKKFDNYEKLWIKTTPII